MSKMSEALALAKMLGVRVIATAYPFRGRPDYRPLSGLPDPRECGRFYWMPGENAVIVPPWVL